MENFFLQSHGIHALVPEGTGSEGGDWFAESGKDTHIGNKSKYLITERS